MTETPGQSASGHGHRQSHFAAIVPDIADRVVESGTFAAQGARIAPVPVDEEGLIVDRIPPEARVVCVTPSHQFPLGAVMSARRRTSLLDVCKRRRAVVIEDDYDGEFRFADRPLDALQTLDRVRSVFYVGTFSKSPRSRDCTSRRGASLWRKNP